jgi:Undecaprenyl-phosphate glucose phosphotransferase
MDTGCPSPVAQDGALIWRDHRQGSATFLAILRIGLVAAAVAGLLSIGQSTVSSDSRAAVLATIFVILFAVLTMSGPKRCQRLDLRGQVSVSTMQLSLAAAGVLLPDYLLNLQHGSPAVALLRGIAAAYAAVILAEVLAAGILRRFRHWFACRVIVIGDGPEAERMAMRIAADPIVESVHVSPLQRSLGREPLDALFSRCRANAALVVLPVKSNDEVHEILDELRHLPIEVRVLPDLSNFPVSPTSVSSLGGLPLLGIMEKPLLEWEVAVKRAEDLIIGSLLLLLTAPLMVFIACAIRLDSSGPVLFRQPRVGFCNRQFEIFKFRTMVASATDLHADRLVSRGDPRVTRIGKWLRRSSLDELPQLFNVIRGDMSLVGPRPHAARAKAGDLLYDDAVEQYASRFRIKPGITGWAQVNGWRGQTDTVDKLRQRVEHDLHYISHWSLGLDLAILLKTVTALFGGANAF